MSSEESEEVNQLGSPTRNSDTTLPTTGPETRPSPTPRVVDATTATNTTEPGQVKSTM
jgi:hypothetical protein